MRDLAASVLTEIELLADKIERTQAEETAQRLAEQHKRLLEVAQTVVSSLALDQILPQLQRTLQLVVAHEALSIYWLDTAAGLLRPAHQVAPAWLSDHVSSWPIPIGSGLAGAVARSGHAEMVNNAQLDPRSIYPPGTADPPEHHQISIPLRVTEQIRSVFLMSRTSSEPFTEQEFELAQIFMSFASLAIENARLFEQTKLAEERTRRLSEVAFEGIANHDQGVILDANQALAAILGYEHAEIIGMPLLDFAAPESRDLITTNIRTGSAQPYEVVGLRKDGTRVVVEIQAKPLSYQGQSVRVTAIRDITDRKQAEAALRESEDRYRSFFEHSIDAILLTAPDGSVFAANPEACRIFDRSEADICQVGRNGLIDTADARLPAALEQRERTGTFKGELTFLRKDGTPFPGELSTALFRDRDGLTKTSMIIRDITERKHAEEALRASQMLLQGIVDHAPMSIAIQDIADGRYLLVNRSLAAVTGLTVEQLLGKTIAELYPPETVAIWRAQDRSIAITRQSIQVEDDVRHSDGRLHTSLGIKFPLYDTKGDVYAIGGIFTDITERKLAEQEREQLIDALQEALANIKTLRGMLPICASCKKIRDDSGYWNQIEAYVQAHSDAVFSHGICPDCAKQLYGDIYKD